MLRAIQHIDPHYRSRASFVSLLLAAVIGSLSYTSYTFWFIPTEASFIPNLAAGLVALFLVIPVIRGDFLATHKLDALTVLNVMLLFYLTSIVTRMGLGGTGFAGWLLESPTFIIALGVIAAANFNAHKYGELAVLALVALGGINVFSVSEVMGLWGWVFLVLFAIGALLTLDLNKLTGKKPAREGR